MAMKKLIDIGQSDAEKKQWAKIRRNVPFKFRMPTTDEESQGLRMKSTNARGSRQEEADRVKWSLVQLVEFVESEKVRLAVVLSKDYKQISNPVLFKHLQTLKPAEGSEDMK